MRDHIAASVGWSVGFNDHTVRVERTQDLFSIGCYPPVNIAAYQLVDIGIVHSASLFRNILERVDVSTLYSMVTPSLYLAHCACRGPIEIKRLVPELAFRLLKDSLKLNQLCSAKWPVIQLQVWACVVLAQVYHALQAQIAAQAGVEVFDVSLALLVRLTPQWLQRSICPQEHVVHFGRDLGLIRMSSRHQIEVPWIDPAWVSSPPALAIQPMATVRHRPPKKPRPATSFGRVGALSPGATFTHILSGFYMTNR